MANLVIDPDGKQREVTEEQFSRLTEKGLLAPPYAGEVAYRLAHGVEWREVAANLRKKPAKRRSKK